MSDPIIPGIPTDGVLDSFTTVPPSVSLQWTGSDYSEKYDLYRSDDPVNIGDLIQENVEAVDGVVSVTDSSVELGSRYYYRLAGVNEDGYFGLPSSAIEVDELVLPILKATDVDAMETAVSDFLLGVLGGSVGIVREMDRGPEEPEPYVSYRITGPTALSGDDSRDGGTMITGPRSFSLSLNFCGESDREMAVTIQTALSSETLCAPLDAVDIGISKVGTPTDLSEEAENGWKRRTRMEVVLFATAGITVDPGEISTVQENGIVGENSLVVEI